MAEAHGDQGFPSSFNIIDHSTSADEFIGIKYYIALIPYDLILCDYTYIHHTSIDQNINFDNAVLKNVNNNWNICVFFIQGFL